MKRSRYPLPARANLSSGFWGCSFCGGSGCLACDRESKRKYKERFPDGPKPILTIEDEYDPSLAVMQDVGSPNVETPTFFQSQRVTTLSRK